MPYKPLTEQEIAEVQAAGLELYDIRMVAAMLKVTTRSVQNYIQSGKLKGRKIGGRWRFSKEDIERYINGDN